jgi:hypothetical protein
MTWGMEQAAQTRVVDASGLLEHLLRTHLPLPALDLPEELDAASARDLILRDLRPDLAADEGEDVIPDDEVSRRA